MKVAYLSTEKLVIKELIDNTYSINLASYTFERFREFCISVNENFEDYILQLINNICKFFQVEKLIQTI